MSSLWTHGPFQSFEKTKRVTFDKDMGKAMAPNFPSQQSVKLVIKLTLTFYQYNQSEIKL